MSGYTPVSTGYDAHAGARHGAAMAAAAREAVNLSIPSDEEMIEEHGQWSQRFPKGNFIAHYGKSSGKGPDGNGFGLNMHSNAELHRHDPLYRDDRRQPPEIFINDASNIPRTITFHPDDRWDKPPSCLDQ